MFGLPPTAKPKVRKEQIGKVPKHQNQPLEEMETEKEKGPKDESSQRLFVGPN